MVFTCWDEFAQGSNCKFETADNLYDRKLRTANKIT